MKHENTIVILLLLDGMTVLEKFTEQLPQKLLANKNFFEITKTTKHKHKQFPMSICALCFITVFYFHFFSKKKHINFSVLENILITLHCITDNETEKVKK